MVGAGTRGKETFLYPAVTLWELGGGGTMIQAQEVLLQKPLPQEISRPSPGNPAPGGGVAGIVSGAGS